MNLLVDYIIWAATSPHLVLGYSREVLHRQMDGIPGEERTRLEAENTLEFLSISQS
jgi:hypothetical protein